MKKYLIISMILVSILLAGCNNDVPMNAFDSCFAKCMEISDYEDEALERYEKNNRKCFDNLFLMEDNCLKYDDEHQDSYDFMECNREADEYMFNCIERVNEGYEKFADVKCFSVCVGTGSYEGDLN